MNIIGNPKYLHIGTKAVLAHIMTKEEYCDYRGWKVPENEDPSESGYFVEYMDGGKPNHSDHVGYVSWSPKDVFDKSYKANGSLSFSAALEALKSGRKVARSGWNGKDQYVVAQQGQEIESTYVWNPHNKAHAEKLGGWIKVHLTAHLKQHKTI